jgi:hypothetical protein
VLDAGEEIARQFIQHLIAGLDMDDTQRKNASFHPAAENQ